MTRLSILMIARSAIPASPHLQAEAIDTLIAVAHELLRNSAEFAVLLRDINAEWVGN